MNPFHNLINKICILFSSPAHGKDVIVGVGDSGIDMKSTFFYDAEHTVEFGEKINNDHRKVAMYYDWQNQADDQTEGHGTHVCGIIAGNAADPSVSMYNV